MNAYEILECERNASSDVLKRQYHKLLLVYHPDKCGSGGVVRFMQIQAAFKLLQDDKSRLDYDNCLRQSDLERDVESESTSDCLSITRDFKLDSREVYSKECHRCGGQFVVPASEYLAMLSSFDSKDRDTIFIKLQCDSCSIFLDVLLI